MTMPQPRVHSTSQPLHGDIRGILQRDQRRFEQTDAGFSLCHRRGRPKIEHAGFPVQVIFSGLIQLFQNVQEVEALTGTEP